jgi:NifU-like protein involved in Fe-S cluster formation
VNQRDAFFDTTHVMKNGSIHDPFIVEQQSKSNDMWLRLYSQLDSEGKFEVRYHVHGCPHLIAISSMVISDLQKKSIQELETLDIREYEMIIDLPKTKKDRLFLLEDAIKGCIKHFKRA